MPTITADRVKDKNIFAKSKVNGYDSTFKNVVKVFNPGELIGTVFSYIEKPEGLYWMVYLTQSDYNNFNTTYIKHNQSQLNLPDLPNILETISQEQEKKLIAQKGVLQYNIDRYLPWIIGGLIVALSLPALTGLIKKNK
jgi:hypothetical protein